MGATPAWANKALDDEMRQAGQLVLLTTLPAADGTGWAEPTATSYARLAVPANTWTVATGRATSYPLDAFWPDAAAGGGDWGTIRGWGWVRSGVLRVWEPVARATTIREGDTDNGFVAGALTVRA